MKWEVVRATAVRRWTGTEDDVHATYRHQIAILQPGGETCVTRSTSERHRRDTSAPVQPDPSTSARPPYAGVMPRSPALVVLAAGAGTRFVGPSHKLSSRLAATGADPAETVIERAVRHALRADAGPVIVVVGATDHHLGDDLGERVTVRRNPAWAEGQATSLQAGIDAARAGGHDAIVVGLADQPGIAPAAWRRVAGAPGPIAVATYDGRRANPVRLDAEIWHLLPTSGDEGARTLMRVRPELVVAVPCTGSPADIDTEEDLRRWQSN